MRQRCLDRRLQHPEVVMMSRSVISDSELGYSVATVTLEHYLFLGGGTWIDQTHGTATSVSCGVFMYSLKVTHLQNVKLTHDVI